MNTPRAAPNTVRLGPEGQLLGGSPQDIVEFLTSPHTLDYTLMSDFFLTYRMFMDATGLLELLLGRLEWAIGVQNEVNRALRQSQNARNSEKGRDVCVRTFVVLRHWVLNFFADDFVPSHAIRSTFADTLNRLSGCSMVQQDANSQRIVFQLKSIWTKSVSMYWNVPQDLATIYSGGLVGEKLAVENKNANHRLSLKQPHVRRKTILSLYQDIPVYNPQQSEEGGGAGAGGGENADKSIPSIWTNSSIDGIADDDHPLKRGHSTINGHIIRGGIAAPRNAGLTLIQPPTPIKANKTAAAAAAEGSLVSSPEVKDILQKKDAKSRSTRQSLNMKLVRFATRLIGEHEMEELSREHVSPRVTESISLDLRYDVLGQRVLQELRHLVESKEKQLNNKNQNEEVFEGFTFANDGEKEEAGGGGQGDHSGGRESSRSYVSYTSSLDFDFNLVSTPQKTPARLKKQQRYSNLNFNSPTKQPRSPTKENRGKLTASFIEAINYSVRNSDVANVTTESCGMFGVDAEAVAGLAQIPDDTTEEDAIVAALQKLEGTYVKGEKKVRRQSRDRDIGQRMQDEGIEDESRDGQDLQNSIIGLYDDDEDGLDSSMVQNVHDLDIPAGFKPSKSLGRRPSPSLSVDVSGGPSDSYLPDAIEFGASSIAELFSNGRHLPFILNYDAETLAQHMTLIERDSLAEVDWKELIEARWNKKLEPVQSWTSYLVAKTNIGVDMVITRFNLVVNWVISEILLTKRLAERICVVSRFIHIAFLCREMQNFATLMQIVLALSSSHVSRLKETWQHILPQDKKILAELEQIVVPLKNFHNLRQEFVSIDPEKGCIPFVGLSLSDLTFNNERLKLSEDGDVNFEQYKTSASIVKSLIQCIEWSKNYRFQTDVDIVAKCLYLQCLTSAEMDQCFDYLVDP